MLSEKTYNFFVVEKILIDHALPCTVKKIDIKEMKDHEPPRKDLL